MKKYILFLLFLTACISNKKYVENVNVFCSKKDNLDFCYDENNIPITGIINFNNGKLIEYQNGLRNGSAKEFYENGNIKFEAMFQNSTLDGIAKEFYEDGSLKSQKIFKDGKEV